MFYYAGIGSRETPNTILSVFEELGKLLVNHGGILRSGRAPGADQAFERGCIAANGNCEIFVPWFGFPKDSDLRYRSAFVFDKLDNSQRDCAIASVKQYHPAPDRLSPGAMKLMARNYCQMHGPTIDSPMTDFIICYTRDGKATGGTGQAIRMAETAGIAVLNAYGFKNRPADFVRHVIDYVQKTYK